jgi:hypothetical protein
MIQVNDLRFRQYFAAKILSFNDSLSCCKTRFGGILWRCVGLGGPVDREMALEMVLA